MKPGDTFKINDIWYIVDSNGWWCELEHNDPAKFKEIYKEEVK